VKELTPPDLRRCQAGKPNGASFMTCGGRPGLVRCSDEPVVIATENKPGSDGQVGSMSLCQHCVEVFVRQLGADYATIAPIQGGR
jgi:hypothetical protein